jgi:tetratricopeptide (TPR) repeat protein
MITVVLGSCSNKNLVKQGDKYFESGDYMIASRFYEQNYKQEEDSHSAERLIVSYRHLQEYERLEKLYLKLVENDPSAHSESLAKIQLKLGKYDEAKKTLDGQLLQSEVGAVLLRYAESEGSCNSNCEENEEKKYVLELSAAQSIDQGNPNVKFFWEYDGKIQTGITSKFYFKSSGEKTVYLHAKDMNTGIMSKRVDSTIVNIPEQNNFTIVNGSNKELWHDTELSFSAGDVNEAYTYLWDLGDGNFKLGPNITHKYIQGGEFTIRLIVYDENGNCNSCVQQNTQILYFIK